MDHEVVVTLDATGNGQARVLDYERVDVCRTKRGQWVYVGYRGPLSRFLYMGNAGSLSRQNGPDLFFVPSSEVKKLFEDCGYDDLIEQYFHPGHVRVREAVC